MMSHRFQRNSIRVDVDTALAYAQRGLAQASGLGIILAILRNASQATNAADIGPSLAPTLTSQPFKTIVGGAGKVQILAMAGATGAGGTSVAGEDLDFELLQDGNPLSPPVHRQITLSTNDNTGATLVFTASVTPGSTHTWAIRITNVTTPAHTSVLVADTGVVRLQEAFN